MTNKKYITVTRDNIASMMFRKCRFSWNWHLGDEPHDTGIVCGWHPQDNACLVSCVVDDGEESVIQLDGVEVLVEDPE